MTNIRVKVIEIIVFLHEFRLWWNHKDCPNSHPWTWTCNFKRLQGSVRTCRILKQVSSFKTINVLSDRSNGKTLNMVNPVDLQHFSKVAVTGMVLQNSITNLCPDKQHWRLILLDQPISSVAQGKLYLLPKQKAFVNHANLTISELITLKLKLI